eukprot:6418825-Ditylum_brightwellii.AAC.1
MHDLINHKAKHQIYSSTDKSVTDNKPGSKISDYGKGNYDCVLTQQMWQSVVQAEDLHCFCLQIQYVPFAIDKKRY